MKIQAFIFFLIPGFAFAAETPDKIQFNRDIRPILSSKCIHCHGFDEKDRKGKLRLDISTGEHGPFVTRDGQQAIKPFHPEQSKVWELINTDDKDEIMPPVKEKKELNKEEKALIKAWILQGAKWEGHWAFNPPKKASRPKTEQSSWAKNDIDHYILARLEKEGLKPSPRAPKYKLIRRVSYDLTGLPPSLEEINAYLNDKSPNAYEKMVDRYLASRSYGERMTVNWLDAARYGDTSVYHADGPRTMWPWRDWVIDSFNDNMPYSKFTIDQLAGDLYKNPKDEEIIATAFLRNNGTTDEGGAFPEEYRVEYTIDRTETTSKIWLGLTMGCAQCHEHKYDPISQKEFYEMYAYFNVSEDRGMQTRRGNAAPTHKIVSRKDKMRIAELDKKIKGSELALQKRASQVDKPFQDWIVSKTKTIKQGKKIEPPGLVHYFPLDESTGQVISDAAQPSCVGSLSGKLVSVKRASYQGMKLNGRTSFAFPKAGKTIEHNKPFTFTGWIRLPKKTGASAIFGKMNEGNKFRGYDFWTEGHSVGTHLIHSWPNDAIKVTSKNKLKPDQWHFVAVSYDGSTKANGVKIYIDGKLSPNHIQADTLKNTIKSKVSFNIGKRSNSAGYSGDVDDIRIYDRQLKENEIIALQDGQDPVTGILATATDKRTKDQLKYLKDHYISNYDKESQTINKELQKHNHEKNKLRSSNRNVMVMRNQAKPRKTYILDRGIYDQPIKDEEIFPGTPKILPAMKKDSPKNRLGLAQWLMMDENPLTSRVTANRFWMMIFGNGIVDTVDDFGLQGSWPTHPELLDWLASDLKEHNWDMKRFFKQMLMSATYQQDTQVTPALYEKDPKNKLLARGPRFRLQGDFIRDTFLSVSGLLVDKVGGPGVKPVQPAGLWKEVSLSNNLIFKPDSGEKLYRKSLYTYWKRSAPPPNMRTFDAPTREKCVLERPRTNTPLQALVLMNDPQFVEASRAFGERIIKEGGNTFESRIDFAFRLVTSRKPNEVNIKSLRKIYNTLNEKYTKSKSDAEALVNAGSAPRDKNLNASEHAVWTMIGNILLNMDEAINKG